ncbi:DUF3157 family protein [Vibrio sp. CAIM 722]|uniref:DUF3157 family protein n=1 Tax=Vibrio eleionomae TaxID=2653505 RepID=A0A7X4LL38_9VIBR|nr:DUF3157 family protein [Vibrio eleionomae]MZI93806.1 DUF3157 family protein [Vibrio eleionomae]
MKTLLSITCLVWTSLASASQIATLSDGRQVTLNDDFTWQYVVSKQPTKSAKTQQKLISPVATIAAPVAAPVIHHSMPTSIINLGSNKPLLQLSDSGVDVVLGAADYDDGELTIPTVITNQTHQSAIRIDIDWQLQDGQGHPLQSGTHTVWQSIKRMGDTYLRPQTSADGKPLNIEVTQLKQYQLKAKITQVEMR